MNTGADNTSQDLEQIARTTQIIVASLALGVVAFFAIAFFVGEKPEEDATPIISYIGVAFAVIAILARVVVPAQVVSIARRKIAQGLWPATAEEPASDLDKLGQVYLTKTIIAAAILEGAAFLVLIGYLLEGQVASLAVAFILLAGIVLLFPTRSSVVYWAENQLQQVEAIRQFDSRS